MEDTPLYVKNYIYFYSLISLYAFYICFKYWKHISLNSKEYRQFLFGTWKIVVWITGALVIIVPSPYLNLHSWDYFIATFQSVFAFYTAPWSVGIFYRQFFKLESNFNELFLSLFFMMFTSSWGVELYLILRDGYPPPDSIPILIVSTVFYVLVGLVFNLDWDIERGIHLSFVKKRWLIKTNSNVLKKIWWVVLLIGAFVIAYVYQIYIK